MQNNKKEEELSERFFISEGFNLNDIDLEGLIESTPPSFYDPHSVTPTLVPAQTNTVQIKLKFEDVDVALELLELTSFQERCKVDFKIKGVIDSPISAIVLLNEIASKERCFQTLVFVGPNESLDVDFSSKLFMVDEYMIEGNNIFITMKRST